MHHVLGQPDLTREQLSEWLDSLAPTEREASITGLSRTELRRMWQLAEDADPLSPDFFVPEDADDLVDVRHQGWNSIPGPAVLHRFTKVFTRRDGQIFGFNDAPAGPLIGPGYFCLGRADDDIEAARGALCIDYLRVPEDPAPTGWPPIRRNETGLQRFVYGGTQDWMRRVSAHVSIGMPYRGARKLPFPFVLCRVDRD